MRKNNVLLSAAIAATLIMPMTSAYAGLVNFYPTTPPPCAGDAASACTAAVPVTLGANTYNVVPIPPVANKTPGILYGTPLFGNPSKVILPAKAGEYAVAVWEIEGTPSGEIQVTASLAGAEFAAVGSSTTDKDVWLQYVPNTTTVPHPTSPTIKGLNNTNQGDCVKASECTWLLTGLTNSNLVTGDSLYIVYKITNAAGLATAGGEVKLTAKLGTVFDDDIMGTDTITIATGRDPITFNFKPTDNTDIRVSAEDLKTFLTKKPVGDPELLTSYDAIFGYLVFKQTAGIKLADGYAEWNIGNEENTAILTIQEGGQFAASLTGSKGQVYLQLEPSLGTIAATTVTITDATWNLAKDDLSKITDPINGKTIDGNLESLVPIVIKADGTSDINTTPDDFPQAHLVLSYANDNNVQKVDYPVATDPANPITVALTKYKLDGVSCRIFSVVGPGGTDELNLRITNDSTAVGQVKGTLYGKDGKQVGNTEVLAEKLEKLQTIRLTSKDLADKFGTWTGRGMLVLSATVPRIEVLTLLREVNPLCTSCGGGNPLENHSLGVTGNSCRN